MEIDVLTLFPEVFEPYLQTSVIKRAQDSEAVQVKLVNFREYSLDRHHTVDDYPFGGGAGMVLKPEPLFRAVEALNKDDKAIDRIILLSPQGKPFTQNIAKELSNVQRLVLICGHYEGFDERIREHLVTDELSIGDYVLTGGELAALVVMDAVIRLIPGVLGNPDSASSDSFSNGLLEHPQYTRPRKFLDWEVPEVLLSGNHQDIAKWRHEQSLLRTLQRRPELLANVEVSQKDREWLKQNQRNEPTV